MLAHLKIPQIWQGGRGLNIGNLKKTGEKTKSLEYGRRWVNEYGKWLEIGEKDKIPQIWQGGRELNTGNVKKTEETTKYLVVQKGVSRCMGIGCLNLLLDNYQFSCGVKSGQWKPQSMALLSSLWNFLPNEFLFNFNWFCSNRSKLSGKAELQF